MWILGGCRWWSAPSSCPASWSATAQLRNIGVALDDDLIQSIATSPRRSSAARGFLVGYVADGRSWWAVARASTRDDISTRLPDVQVFDLAPHWMDDARLEVLRSRALTLDSLATDFPSAMESKY
jgi:hypothetical protein